MRIEQGIKLDFDSVMMRPMTSSLNSRSEVQLERTFKFMHSPKTWTGVPIIAANMDTVGTIEMALELQKHKMITALHKFIGLDEIAEAIQNKGLDTRYIAFSTGIRPQDFKRLEQFKNTNSWAMVEDGKTRMVSPANAKFPPARTLSDAIDIIMIDVPNGYIKNFFEGCKKIREMFPEHIIMAGNVVTADITETLIQYAGVDVVKVGIGPGEACFLGTTLVKTEKEYKKISDITIGESVLTHNGSYQTVSNIFSKEVENLVKINDNIICTEDHKFLVVHKDDYEKVTEENYLEFAQWKSAELLTEDFYLLEIHN